MVQAEPHQEIFLADVVFYVMLFVAWAGSLAVTGAISYLAGRMRGQNDKIADLLDAISALREEPQKPEGPQ